MDSQRGWLDPLQLGRHPGYGHDGAAIGQYGYLRVVPQTCVAVALLTNGGGARELYAALFRELLGDLAGVRMPDAFEPPAQAPVVDFSRYVGTYKRAGVVITASERGGAPHLVDEFVDDMKDFSPPLDVDLYAVTESVFAGTGAGPSLSEGYMPVAFSTLGDGTERCCIGMRAAPKVA